MSTITNGSADRFQRIAKSAVLAAAKSESWYWCEPSTAEAQHVLDVASTEGLLDGMATLDEDGRSEVLAAVVSLIAAEYENQQSVIESLAQEVAEQHSVNELQALLRDGDLPPPERYSYELALRIHQHAQDYTIGELETLSTLGGNTPSEAMAYKDAASLRRRIYAQRRGTASMAATVA